MIPYAGSCHFNHSADLTPQNVSPSLRPPTTSVAQSGRDNGSVSDRDRQMAEYLLGEGYKDPAAVLIGGVLEQYLRKQCEKSGIEVNSDSGKPRKADTLNSDLARQAFTA